MKVNLLRKSFLDFFENKGHKVLASDSLVPEDDPTLLFTSAGMNQFKRQFMGKDIKYKRVATCQKCLRTGDLEQVGKTPYHHTFFEMLGNFSFGDYFKKEAISFAWEFLTKELGLKEENLWVSVYKDDDEAYNIWINDIGIPKDKIVKRGDKENFWPSEALTKGPNGPCGPCSEIYYDRGKKFGCGEKDCKPGNNCCFRYYEIWNLVFTEFKREGEIGKRGRLIPLPNKNIDTGMGLERLAQVMQGVNSSYEIDIFKPLIDYIIGYTGANYQKDKDASYINAIADHIKAATFAICDGVIPSNEERGYVIRKLIRRSIVMLEHFKVKKPFLYKLVPIIVDEMKQPYPELEKRRENISQIILEEEKKYETLKHTLPLRQEEFKRRCEDSADAGRLIFEFYDTYGIPREITENWAKTILGRDYQQTTVNKMYNMSMELQRERARGSSKIKTEIFSQSLRDEISDIASTKFIGYDRLEAKSEVLAIIKEGKRTTNAKEEDKVQIILDKTPFYAEAGGQIGDTGLMKAKGLKIEVYDTKVFDGRYLHYAEVKSGQLKINQEVEMIVDKERRLQIEKNHTATHLLQYALRKVLGSHIEQSGSLVSDERLRFDFTHFKQINQEQLNRIEQIVNNCIQENNQVTAQQMKLEEAKKINALAFFKEKYADIVRVISIGDYSKELCGGTHIDSTGKIGLFKITHTSSVASGLRRIEAVTSDRAVKFIEKEEELLKDMQRLLKTDIFNIPQKVRSLIEENKNLRKEINSLRINLLRAELDKIISEAKSIGRTKIITYGLQEYDMDSLRKLCDMIKQRMDSGIIILFSKINNKVIGLVSLSSDLINKNITTDNIVKKINKKLGSKGGGRAELAQIGGGDPKRLHSCLKQCYEIAKEEFKKNKLM